MNTFGQGFQFGLVSGLYNNMFGSSMMGYSNAYMANPFCNYSFSPMFFSPTFSFNSFTPYSTPMDSFNFSYSQNLNPFSFWSSNSYYNNSTVTTPQTQSNYNYYSNIPTLDITHYDYTSKPSTSESTVVIKASTSTQTQSKATDTNPVDTKPVDTKPVDTKADSSTRQSSSTKKTKTERKSTSKSKNDTKKEVEIDYNVENLKAKWKKKKPNLNLSDEFYNKIIKISKDIKCDPNDLMGIINLESAGTFDPAKKNSIGATGLIQFLPDVTEKDINNGAARDYVKRVGKRTSELAKMSAEEQLDYVEKYLKSWIKEKGIKGQIDGATLYSLVFWPKAANKDENYVIAHEGSKVYTQNPLLDKDNSDKAITKKDLGERLKDFIA